MSGASRRHNIITANVLAKLHAQLEQRPCTVFPSDMRVKVMATTSYFYPDVTVVCGEAILEDDWQDTLLNPTLIVEVLSKSTEAYDRGEKFKHYRQFPTLVEYLLIAQDRFAVEHYLRQPNNEWQRSEFSDLSEVVQLPAIQCHLALTDIYAKVIILVK
jgi:Uma2 family endonuclease